MPVIESKVDLASADAQANAEAWSGLRDELLERRAEAALGGNERSRERHVGRGKLLPRERVLRLLDPGSPFLEIGALAAFGMYEGDVHGAGMIAGIGRVAGRECVIVCNDATIKGGTYYPMTVKKHLRAQEIARENGCPASISSIRAARICRTRPRSFPIASISGGSSTIRRRSRRKASPRSRW